MARIAATLERIKQDLPSFLPEAEIRAACREVGHAWRERKCGPVQTVHLFLLQVLCFNTAMTHLRLLAKAAVAAPAYCRARMRLPSEVLQKLLRRSATVLSASGASRPWCGLRGIGKGDIGDRKRGHRRLC